MNQPKKNQHNHVETNVSRGKEKNTPSSNITSWIKQHQIAAKNAAKHLLDTPLSSILTILVVAIALSLPAALQIIIKNLETGQTAINEQAKVSLYLKKETRKDDITTLIQQLKDNNSILNVTFISADQALLEFQESSNLGNTLGSLKKNPLPASIIVTPDTQLMNVNDIELLVADFQELEAVELAQIDVMWLKKLFSIIELAKHFSIGISVFLIFAVLILIGNTIRNLGQRFQTEIAISKLVGATDAYVRRSFLYSGLAYGLLGSIFALFFVFIGILWLYPQMNEIASLYGTNIQIIGLATNDIFSLIAIGTVLGLGGSWVAANRIINQISL